FRIIRQLRDAGVGVVHISHRLEELKRISDRVTVMRDGQYIATVDTKAAAIAEIIRMMVGRTIYEEAPEIPEVADPNVVLDVRDLARGRAVRGVSFTVRRGEILGFAGLVGAGRTEVAREVFGADRPDSAQIRVHGRPTRINGPGDAVRQGIGYLSEDRKRYGLALGMDVETNIVLATLRKFLRAFGRVDARRTRATAEQLVQRLAIKTPSLRQKVRNLSGGTQQKVVVAKWLTANTDIFSLLSPNCLQFDNVVGILIATAVNGILALGVTFVIISGSIDLSIGTVMTLSSVMTAVFITEWHAPVPVGILAGVSTGALAGIVNGTLVAKLKIPSFIATLGMLNVAKGLALVVSGLKPIYFNDTPDFNRA